MEAFFMSQLRHENIVQLVGLCMHPLFVFFFFFLFFSFSSIYIYSPRCLVTEFVPCGDLYHMLQVLKNFKREEKEKRKRRKKREE